MLGGGWVGFLLGGLLAVGAVGVLLIVRSLRRPPPEGSGAHDSSVGRPGNALAEYALPPRWVPGAGAPDPMPGPPGNALAEGVPRRGAFTPRWWQTTALLFALLGVVGLALGLYVGMAIFAGTWGRSGFGPLYVAEAIGVALAFVASALLATAREAFRPAKERRVDSRRGRRALPILFGFVFPFVAVYAGLYVAAAVRSHIEERAQAEHLRHIASPILEGPQRGLCAPPVYGVRGGFPVVRLTARLPWRGRYGWYALGEDQRGHAYVGRIDTTLAPGVTSLTLCLDRYEGKPCLPGDVAWPVRITFLNVRFMERYPIWSDERRGAPYAILDVRPGHRFLSIPAGTPGQSRH